MSYNGWKNFNTWNVALWIENDEPLYRAAVAYMRKHPHGTYCGFIKAMGMDFDWTPDGIKYKSNLLDYEALNNMMRYIAS